MLVTDLITQPEAVVPAVVMVIVIVLRRVRKLAITIDMTA